MAGRKKSRRGVEVKGMDNFQYGYRTEPARAARAPAAVHRSVVNPTALKRAYMLHNFQFVLQQDILRLWSTPGAAHRQRSVAEALTLCGAVPPWDFVVAVIARGGWEGIQCPICLDEPQVARITSCGHVFCLICVLQYIFRRTAEGKERTCPVCSDCVTTTSLRPCIVRLVATPCVGAQASFTMLRRSADSCILLRQGDPRWKEESSVGGEPCLPLYGEPSATYSRYIISTESSENTLREDECMTVIKQISLLETNPRPFTSFDDNLLKRAGEALQLVQQGVPKIELHQDQLFAGEVCYSPPLAPKQSGREALAPYEFYGESDGQGYYMHPITYKMLCVDAETRSLPLCDTVEAPVEKITTFVQDEMSKKRYKVFAHVPLHATVNLCLLDLSGMVLPSTMEAFESTLTRLRKVQQMRETGAGSSAGDCTWKDYLRRYRFGWRNDGERTSDGMTPMSELFMTDLSADLERMPSPDLSPSDGFPSLTSGLGAPAVGDAAKRSCWTTRSSLRLFSRPPTRTVAPTWGGHRFDKNKLLSNEPLLEGGKK